MTSSILLMVNYIIQTLLVIFAGLDVNMAILSVLFLNGAFMVEKLEKIEKSISK